MVAFSSITGYGARLPLSRNAVSQALSERMARIYLNCRWLRLARNLGIATLEWPRIAEGNYAQTRLARSPNLHTLSALNVLLGMGNKPLIASTVTMVVSLAWAAAVPSSSDLLTPAQLQEDEAIVRASLEEGHPGVYRFTE